jgi:hypothetical protein
MTSSFRRGRVLGLGSGFFVSFFTGCFFSLVGGNIGVEDFLGDGSGGANVSGAVSRTGVSIGAGDAADATDSTGRMGETCLVVMVCGTGTGVSVLLLFRGCLVGLVACADGPTAVCCPSTSSGDSLLRFLTAVLFEVFAGGFLSFASLSSKMFAIVAFAIFITRTTDSASSAAS